VVETQATWYIRYATYGVQRIVNYTCRYIKGVFFVHLCFGS